MNEKTAIPFGRPWITDEERQAVQEVLEGPILTHGPQCKAFETEFAGFAGEGAHAVTFSSCMGALHLAWFQMGLGPGDEVITPAMTHTATAHAIELIGARPVFVDCELDTGNIDCSLIESKITPATRALTLVHFLGIPCDMDAVMSIAEKYGLKVIEDCALAVGARFRGTHVGLFGEAGCFSFYPVKHITCGEGGMFLTAHAETAERAAKLRGFGVDRTHTERKVPGQYDVTDLGLNYRMSELQAALGRAQLGRIGAILARRRENFVALKSLLSEIENVTVLDSNSEKHQSTHYCLTAILRGPLASRRDRVIARLNEAGVGTSIYYPHPVPRLSYYRKKYGYQEGEYPNASAVSDHSIALPVGPHVTLHDMERIGEQFRKAIEEVSP